jgi:hypothetical protein
MKENILQSNHLTKTSLENNKNSFSNIPTGIISESPIFISLKSLISLKINLNLLKINSPKKSDLILYNKKKNISQIDICLN